MEASPRACGSCRQPLLEDGSEMFCQHCKFPLHVTCLVKRFCPKCKCPVISEKQAKQYKEATRTAERSAALRFLGLVVTAIAGTTLLSGLIFPMPAINWMVMGGLLFASAIWMTAFWFRRKGAYGFLALLFTVVGWSFQGIAMFVVAGDNSGRERLGWIPLFLLVMASIQLESWRKLSAVLPGER